MKPMSMSVGILTALPLLMNLPPPQCKAAPLPSAASSTTGVAANSQKQPLDVTYIANAGFMIRAAGRKVVIDAPIVAAGIAPPPETIEAITGAREPFDNVDLILVTHQHSDHFDPASLIACLRSSPKARLVAHTQAVDRMRPLDGFASVESQIDEVKLEPGAREQVSRNGITVDVLCLNHMHSQQVRNLAFAVELGGVRFLHMGDSLIDESEAYLNSYSFEQEPIDVLFLNRIDRSEATQQFVAEKIKPSQIVAMHVSPAELAEESKEPKIRTAYPHAIIFKQSMERRSLPIEADFHNLTGEYFGQTPPGATPEVFALGIVSTEANEHSAPSFSPDGNEVFWWANRWPDEGPTMSMTMRRENGRWSAPRISPFGIMPAFSPDGRRIYFFAARPGLEAAKDSQEKFDIWVAEKQGDGWSEPICLNLVARYPELRGASMPRVARNGAIYFMGYAPGPHNDFGIYRAELINGEYAKPELLPRSINLPPFLNWAPFIAPDESYLLFSSNRTGSLDEYGDLYISRRQSDGTWTDPVSLGEPVNSPAQEVFPGLSPDGRYLFFCRYTPGHKNDVYWVDAATIRALRSSTSLPKESSK